MTHHGGKAHQILLSIIAKEYRQKGYEITVAGERTKKRKYVGVLNVDIIAEKENELLLIECGWLSHLNKIRWLRYSATTHNYLKLKQVKIIWVPRLGGVLEQQKSALD